MPEELPDTTTTVAAAAPQIKLSPFCAVDAFAWFLRAEIQFRLKNENSQTRRADHVLAALPDEVFSRISQWIVSRGNTPIQYDDIKTLLLKKFVPTPEERAIRLLNLHNQPLGDQRPSEALADMIALTRLPPADDGTQQILDVLRALWLTRLPDRVRSGITDFSTISEEDLAKKADDLYQASRASSNPNRPTFAITPDDEEALPDDDAEGDTIAAVASKRYSRQYRTSNDFHPNRCQSSSTFRYNNQPPRGTPPRKADGFCYFHSRFGRDARKCKQPCSWPKNL